MAALNRKATSLSSSTTHEGGVARNQSINMQLERSVMSCLLWEDSFYEDGVSIAERIASLVAIANPSVVADLAIRARHDMKLRHVSLLLIRELIRKQDCRKYANILEEICTRPDDITEFMKLYWKDGKVPIANSVKKALSNVFSKFDEYQLAKYNQNKEIKLRDVMFMVHAKPESNMVRYNAQDRKAYKDVSLTEQESLYKRLVDNQLASPETWENRLSRGEDKKEVFESLMSEDKFGALAFLRNLRNMSQANVDKDIIYGYAKNLNVDKILPYQFITAARINPMYEDMLEPLMMKCMNGIEKVSGKTRILIDVSDSMDDNISGRGETKRIDAATGLAIIAREMFNDVEIFTFSQKVVQVQPRRGFALRDAVLNSQVHSSTRLGMALQHVDSSEIDRLIVLTDEQSSDTIHSPKAKNAYMINVAAYKNSVAFGKWNSISGWSEAVLKYIVALEAM